MKKMLITSILGILLAQSVVAEQSMSMLEHVDTTDCSIDQLKNAIRTTSRIRFAENPVTVLDEVMKISLDDKAQGAKVVIEKINPIIDRASYAKMVASAENTVKKAKEGKVITIEPKKYLISYDLKNPAQKIDKKGVIEAQVTCRIETARPLKDGRKPEKPLAYSARLVSFEIKQ